MAKAKKLPSGNWRTRAYDYTDENGTPHYKSFTSSTKKESEFLAAEFAINKKVKGKKTNLTVGEAIDEYISVSEPICSVTTISGYKKIRKYAFQNLMPIKLENLDVDLINKAIIKESERKSVRCGNGKISTNEGNTISPKTVKNEYGLISAILRIHRNDINTNLIKLPKVPKKIVELLPADVIYSVVKDTPIELAALLAMWLSFSESEICGLTKSKSLLEGWKYICINEVVVYADGKEHRKDLAKNNTRKRVLRLPDRIKELIEQLPPEQDRLVELSGHAMYDRFRKLLKKNGLPHMTFHNLRHVNASVMAVLQIQDKYAQERGGWKTDYVMKNVYTHTFDNERNRADDKIDNYFNEILDKHDTKYDTKK